LKAERPFLLKSAISVFDQVLLSGLNLLIGVALIRFATKETYGLYSQVMAAGLLSTTILGALITSALNTLAVRLSTIERQQMVARVARLQWICAALFAVICGVGLFALDTLVTLGENPVFLACAFALLVWTQGVREYCRAACFIEGSPETVAKIDFVFVLLTMIGASAMLWIERVTVAEIVFVMALANGLSASVYAMRLLRQVDAGTSTDLYLRDVKSLWKLSRWAVIGSLLGWMGLNSYLYLVGGMVGVAALADLNASRLTLMPIVVIGTAWGKVAQPAMGRMIANVDWSGLNRFIVKSLIAIESFAVFYVLALWLMFPLLSAHLLGAKYQNILPFIFLWGLYFAVNAARTMGTVLLSSFGAYRALFWQGALSLAILITMSLLLIPEYGVGGALAAMVLVEVIELATNHLYLLPMVKRHHVVT
jgi:O-antigen/teichoic acid export membrane protein